MPSSCASRAWASPAWGHADVLPSLASGALEALKLYLAQLPGMAPSS
jgi:hypothetical protein